MELPKGNSDPKPPVIETAEQNEKAYLMRLMNACKGNMVEAARLSGWSRATIYRKISVYGVLRMN